MNIQGLDRELCEKRNRVVARREDVEGVPVRFLAESVETLSAGNGIALGQMPNTIDEALAVINAKLPEGAANLTAEDVYIHYLEAANSNFIGDRFMFLGESTLKNIAADAERGFAFMNSHRTGSLSQPSELPFGKTFAGQFQNGVDENGQPQQRALVAFYMLRGKWLEYEDAKGEIHRYYAPVKPNGENGPTTDDLHAMIAGGQVADVSVGLMGGAAMCDVCGVNLRETDCAHAPGTKRSMSDEQVAAQSNKGVPGGRASYTLNDARCGEVSAVFDGAVPGAGVKKVMSLRQKGKLNHREWKEARAVFGSLLTGDLSIDSDLFSEVAEAVESGVRAALAPVDSSESAQAQSDLLAVQAREVTEPEKPAEKLEPKGVEKMEKEQEPVVVASDSAESLTELNTQLAAMRDEVAKLQQRNAKLEADARDVRFTSEIEGVNRGGLRWFGNHEQHKTMLHKLAGAFGEDSPEVKAYVEQNRAFAEQFSESELLKEFGATGNGKHVSAIEELNAKSNEIQTQNPKLTREQAFDLATQQNPALYDQYVSENRGGK